VASCQTIDRVIDPIVADRGSIRTGTQVESEMDDEHLSSLYLRFERRELSWATFLDLAGRYSDNAQGTARALQGIARPQKT